MWQDIYSDLSRRELGEVAAMGFGVGLVKDYSQADDFEQAREVVSLCSPAFFLLPV